MYNRKPSKYLPRKNLAFSLLTLLVLILIGIYTTISSESAEMQSGVRATTVWMDIHIGETTIEQVKEILGRGYRLQRIENEIGIYRSYQYGIVHLNQGWRAAEIWTEQEGEKEIVFRIVFTSPVLNEQAQWSRDFMNLHTIGDFVEYFGRPSFVTWSTEQRGRAIVWAEEGAMAIVGIGMPLDPAAQSEVIIWEFTLFQPKPAEDLKREIVDWPLGGVSRINLYPPGHSTTPDRLPEDPFDWDALLP